MIRSKIEYRNYLKQDKEALGAAGIKDYIFHDIWRFQRKLRRAEYWHNCSKGKLSEFISYICRFMAKNCGRTLGFSIPLNTFGPGLSIAHAGTIVINSHSRIGKNCRLHVCTVMGASTSNSNEAPTIGDNCYIAPGVKIYGAVVIGDNTGIGANAVVNKSFLDGNQSIAGMPAKKISNIGPLQFRSFSVQNSKKRD